MKIVSLLILFVCVCSYASDPINMSLNNVPMFYGLAGSDPKYKAAADKAQEAFLLQSGISKTVDSTKDAATKKAMDSAGKTIDEETPLKSKEVFFVAGASYEVFIKKQVTQKFKNPMIPAMTNTISVGPGKGSLGLLLPF